MLRNECEEHKIVEWMERDDKGLGVLFGIECEVNANVIDGMKEFLVKLQFSVHQKNVSFFFFNWCIFGCRFQI